MPLLPKALERYILGEREDLNRRVYQEIPGNLDGGKDLIAYLDGHLERYPGEVHHVIVFRPTICDPERLSQLVVEAIQFCQRHQSTKRYMRIFFLLDAQATWSWLRLHKAGREKLENGVDTCLSPKRWNIEGMKQRLAKTSKLFAEDVCRSVVAATGGWPSLIDHLFELCGNEDDPRDCAERIMKDLLDKDSSLFQNFMQALGILEHPAATNLVREIISLQDAWVPLEFLTPSEQKEKTDEAPEGVDGILEYLQRMGCVEVINEAVSIDPLVRKLLA